LNIPEEYHFARFVPTISLNEHNIAFARRNHDRKADILVVDPNTETVRFILKLSSGVGNPFEIVQGENVVALFTYGAGLTVWNINDGALIQTGILNEYLAEETYDDQTSIISAEQHHGKLKIAYLTLHSDQFDPPLNCRITWLQEGNSETKSLEIQDELNFQVPDSDCFSSGIYVIHGSLFFFDTLNRCSWFIQRPGNDLNHLNPGFIRVFSTPTGLSTNVGVGDLNKFYDIRSEEPIEVVYEKFILTESALIAQYRIPPPMGVSARLFSKNKIAIFDFS